MAGHRRNVVFLTLDAFGIMPPIAKLTSAQAMYHFLSGYTAKVAGTERGVTTPKETFSACFGAPFLPLHPTPTPRCPAPGSPGTASRAGWWTPAGRNGQPARGHASGSHHTRPRVRPPC